MINWRSLKAGSFFLAFVAFFGFLIITDQKASATINSQINFQGKLTNTNGTNVTNGTYSIVFSIYTVSSGGSSVWTETQPSVSVTDGIFQVALGSVTSLPGSVDFNSSSLYLGIKVGADAEMTPRVQFTAAPYAFNAQNLGGIASTGFAQLGLASAQSETSTNSLIFLNKTSTGNLLRLQQGAVDKFVVDNAGLLTTASVNSSSIVDGSIANADLVNSSLSITAGSGLITGGSVSLGGTVTLDIGAGTGITVNANDVGITADGLNFTELADSLTLDAATTISLGGNNFITNLSGTGDYSIQFGGNTVFQVLDTGAVTIGSALADQTIGIDNGTGSINIATDADANTTNIGTGTGSDSVNIGDSNADVSINDAQWSINGAGAANFTSVTGAGLTSCSSSSSKLLWDSGTGQFSCGTDRASASVRKATNEAITSSTTLQDDNELLFAAGSNQTWVYEVNYIYTTGASGTPDIRVGMNGPTGATCVYQVSDIAHAGNFAAGSTACNTAVVVATTATGTKGGSISGSVTTAATAGNVVFRWAQGTSNATATTVVAGSTLRAFRLDGADYAETYYSSDYSISEGMIVEMAGNGVSQVLRGKTPYSDKQIGIVSTKPGKLIGEADGNGKIIPVALNGRVPIKLSTENGLPKAGDMITTSLSIPGYGMVAKNSGYIVGQLMTDAKDNSDGTADGYVYVRHGYWQAPISMDVSSIFGNNSASSLNAAQPTDVSVISSKQTYGFDQSVADQLLDGFKLLDDRIKTVEGKLDILESSKAMSAVTLKQILEDNKDSLVFVSDVTFEGEITFPDNMAGSVTVAAGDYTKRFEFTKAFRKAPKVVLSPESFIDGAWRISQIDEKGFELQLSKSQATDINFTWQAINVSK